MVIRLWDVLLAICMPIYDCIAGYVIVLLAMCILIYDCIAGYVYTDI